MKKIFILLMAVLILPPALLSSQGDYGTEGVFSLGTGARAIAMGGAYTALSDDASGVAYNPAGTAWMQKQQASMLYYPLYEGAIYNSVVYGLPLLEFGTFGGAFSRFTIGDIKGYDSNDVATETFSFDEYMGSLFYARKIGDNFSAGASVNVLGINSLSTNSAGFGADVGIMYEPVKFVRFGVTVKNAIKPSLALRDESESVPQRYFFGAMGQYDIAGLNVLGSVDATLGENENFKFRAGGEISYNKMVSLRGGYDDGIITLGAGLQYIGIAVDYAYVMNEYLGGLSVANISYSFGMSIEEQKEERSRKVKAQVRKLVDQRIMGEMKRKADLHYEKAYALFDNVKYDEALKELEKSLEWYDRHRLSKRLRKWIRFRIRELYYDRGVKGYKEKNFIVAVENFMILKKYDRKYKDSAEYLQSINKKLGLSGKGAGYFADGVELYVKKMYNESIKVWNKALQENPENKAIKLYIAKARKQIMSASPAKKVVTTKMKAGSDRLYFEAVDAYTSGNMDKALRLWEEAVRVNPDNIRAQRDMEKAKAEMYELQRRGLD